MSKRKLGGVSDLHIEQMERMTEDEMAEFEYMEFQADLAEAEAERHEQYRRQMEAAGRGHLLK